MAKRSLKILPPKELALSDAKKMEVLQPERHKSTQDFKSLPEQIAKSKVFHKNFYLPELREKYQHFDRMKRIDYVFPYARIKPTEHVTLYIDVCKNEQEVEVCALKSKILKKLGYLYVYIEHDSTLYDALAQLGEV
jgi:hypothetical protein